MTPEATAGEIWRQRARRLRQAAVAVLALGIIGTGIVCWTALRGDHVPADPDLITGNKAAEFEAENIYGKPAMVLQRIGRALKQPGAQIIIIMVSALAVAGGCWRLARRMEAGG